MLSRNRSRLIRRSIFAVLLLGMAMQGCAMLLPQPSRPGDTSDLRETPCETLDGRRFRTRAMCTIHAEKLWRELVRTRRER